MNLSRFNRADVTQLLSVVAKRNITFKQALKGSKGVIMRHDVDADIDKSVAMARLEHQIGVKATYFILNTAKYWNHSMWEKLEEIEAMGHEIAWHNNVITQWISGNKTKTVHELITEVLTEFMEHDFDVVGSASHGDRLCYQYNYVNNQVFKQFEKSGLNGKNNLLMYDQVDMHSYGLEYEAYLVPRDVYVSESGGVWSSEVNESDLEDPSKTVQILIHPQWWSL